MGKDKGVACNKYRTKFKNWNQNRTTIKYVSKKDGSVFNYEPLSQEQEEFRQCYLPDTPENRALPFFKARNELPPYWWVSSRGYILSFYGKSPSVIVGQTDERMQVKLPDGTVYLYDLMSTLCFPEKMRFPEKKACQLIEKEGLNAFRRGNVALHHENGWIPGKTQAEMLENVPQNCNPEGHDLLLLSYHNILTHLEKYHNTADKQEKATIVEKAVQTESIKEPVIVIPGTKSRSGIVTHFGIEDINFQDFIIWDKFHPGIAYLTNPLKKFLPQYIMFLAGNELIKSGHESIILEQPDKNLKILAFKATKDVLEKAQKNLVQFFFPTFDKKQA